MKLLHDLWRCCGSLVSQITPRLVGTVFILGACIPGSAQTTLDYGPYSSFGIGKGILGNDFAHPLAACITGAQSDLPASHASVNVSIVYSNDEYSRAFHLDQSAKASFLGIGSGGDDLHFGQEDSRTTRAFDIIVEAYGEHPSQTIDHIDWDPRYAKLMDSLRIPAMPITIPRRWRSRFRVMPITVGAKRRWAVLIMLK